MKRRRFLFSWTANRFAAYLMEHGFRDVTVSPVKYHPFTWVVQWTLLSNNRVSGPQPAQEAYVKCTCGQEAPAEIPTPEKAEACSHCGSRNTERKNAAPPANWYLFCNTCFKESWPNAQADGERSETVRRDVGQEGRS